MVHKNFDSHADKDQPTTGMNVLNPIAATMKTTIKTGTRMHHLKLVYSMLYLGRGLVCVIMCDEFLFHGPRVA